MSESPLVKLNPNISQCPSELSLTAGFSPVALATMGRAAFSGLCSVSQAVETAGVLCSSDTGLKPGVNEKAMQDAMLGCHGLQNAQRRSP